MTASSVLLAATTDYAIPLAAFIVSCAAIGMTFLSQRTSRMGSLEQAMADRIDDLVRQLGEANDKIARLIADNKEIRTELVGCSRNCETLRQENYKLLRKIEGLENGHK